MSISKSSSGDDTARGSPTSSYEHLLRSRSPSAVLFGREEATAVRDSAMCGASASNASPRHQQLPQGAFSTSQAAAETWDAGHAPGDHPFLESASDFSRKTLAGFSSFNSSNSTDAAAAAAEAAAAAATAESNAAVAASDDPICAVAAKQCAAAAAAAAADNAADISPRDSYGGRSAPPLPPTTAFTISPFARMSHQELPSLISHSPPHPHQAQRRSGDSASSGSSEGNSPHGSSTSQSGSLAAEMRELSSSRRGSVDCTVGHSSHLCEGHAAEELFYRLNHARQTVDFVKRQVRAAAGFTQWHSILLHAISSILLNAHARLCLLLAANQCSRLHDFSPFLCFCCRPWPLAS